MVPTALALARPMPMLDVWRCRAMELPYLARVSRRALAIPATQVQSERMSVTSGQTVNNRRVSIYPDNVDLLVFLRCNWLAAEQ